MGECNNYTENLKREKIRHNGTLKKKIHTWISRRSFILLNISLPPLSGKIPLALMFAKVLNFDVSLPVSALKAAEEIPCSL